MNTRADINILEEIKNNQEKFSGKQRQLATFIINNYKEVAFMNSIKLAELSNVSNPTVIRFASRLGFCSYKDMQNNLQSIIQSELSATDRISLLNTSNSNLNIDSEKEYLSIFYQERRNITDSIRAIDEGSIIKATDLIFTTDIVYICGFQASLFLANYTEFALSKIKKNVHQFLDWNRNAYMRLHHSHEHAAAIVIAMPRYPNKTIRFIKEFHSRNIPIVLITDSILFPFYQLADVAFALPLKYFSYVDPLSSVMSLINCLLISVANKDEKQARELLQVYEDYISENNIFYKH